MTATMLADLVRANLALAVAVLLVLALRRTVRTRLGALAAYLLWLTLPLCALAALIAARLPGGGLAPAVELVAAAGRYVAPVTDQPVAIEGLMLAWIAGAAATAGLFWMRQKRFVRSLGQLTAAEGDRRLMVGEHVRTGPVLLGSVWPVIVAPADFASRFGAEAQGLMLAHEEVHLKRGDAAINGLIALVQCLCWFNPLIHLAARRLRVDQEIACDAVVAARFPGARQLYAATLLETALLPLNAPFACHWPPESEKPLKERLTMLNHAPLTPLRLKLGAAAALAIGLLGAGAVWAAAPAPRLVAHPDWVQKPTAADMAKYYPERAMKAHKAGLAVVSCRVTDDGRLSRCKVRKETPAGYGFGAAAVKIADSFQMGTMNGEAGAAVNVPMKFALAD